MADVGVGDVVRRQCWGLMNLSIRSRLVLAMNLLVAGVGAATGWVGVAVSARGIERRLVDEPAANAAGLLQTLSLPVSETMAKHLRQILGADVAAVLADAPTSPVSSLPDDQERTFARRVAEGDVPRRIVLAGQAYLVGQASLEREPPARGEGVRLYVLASESRVQAAKRAAARTIVGVTLGAVVLATGLGLWLAHSISRPVRQLADRMRGLTARAGAERLSADSGPPPARGPPEVVGLGRSFDALVAGLDEARRQMARSARLATLGQVAASVAHELRNPLSGIRMNAQVLADEMARGGKPGCPAPPGRSPPADKPDECLRRIIREADRMGLYLEELLDLARPEAAAGPPENRPAGDQASRIHLEEVAESVVDLLEGRCRHGGVEVRRRWGQDVPAARADPGAMRQVILNLVLNALDATRPGGTITLATRTAPDGAARFEVSDTGAGVAAPAGTDIFEPFVTTKPGGIGLGLFISRRHVERHGGRIGYESSGTGTTFWFELPAAVGDNAGRGTAPEHPGD